MVNKKEVENQEFEVGQSEQASSYELLWKAAFTELDAWAERLNYRDEVFLNATSNYVDSVKRNQENIKALTEQFSKELREWEKGAREELLMTTTAIQHFFPIKSYEEINKVVDDIQKKTTTLLTTPFRVVDGSQAVDKYLETVEQYIAFRKKGREKYIDSVKRTSNVLYENQKVFVNLFTNQIKSAMFPFQKYMKNVTDPSNS